MLIHERFMNSVIVYPVFIFYLSSSYATAEINSENKNTVTTSTQTQDRDGSNNKTLNKATLIKNTHGLELSLANRYVDGDFRYISAGYNYFNDEQGYEIAVPVVYYEKDENIVPLDPEYASKFFNIDLYFRTHRIQYAPPYQRYRYWYIGLLARYTYIEGVTVDSLYQFPSNKSTIVRKSESKLGIGLNFGYRKFIHIAKLKFYWGVSLTVGQYVTGSSDVIYHHGTFSIPSYDDNVFYDLEIVKFGYAF